MRKGVVQTAISTVVLVVLSACSSKEQEFEEQKSETKNQAKTELTKEPSNSDTAEVLSIEKSNNIKVKIVSPQMDPYPEPLPYPDPYPNPEPEPYPEPVKVQLPEPEKQEDPIYEYIEEQAFFPGGKDSMMTYLRNNLHYPDVAKELGIQGRVYVRFVVRKDGTITDVKIVRGVDPSIDKEAKRLVSEMPKWIPGKQNGKAVNSWYNLPIKFQL